jgi:hypothetical protein
MLNQKSIVTIHPIYQNKIFKYLDVPAETVGTLFKIPGFTEHNYLVEINQIFSTKPGYGLIDRTGTVKQPINFYNPCPWRIPSNEIGLDDALKLTVESIVEKNSMVNIMWSGGIDSTVIVTAFLKHHKSLNQIRVLYSPWSTYEHPEYLNFLKKFPEVELIDISGEIYLNTQALDGLYVVGDGGDESHASLDYSFYTKYGFDTLGKNWKDFFSQHNSDPNFLDFCEKYFRLSGRDINTVLEARWWFYLSCKLYGTFFETKWPYFICGYDNFEPNRLISFFNNNYYQNFIYYNTDKIIQEDNYYHWRQFLKDYCCSFDGLSDWAHNHKKINSVQIIEYSYKKLSLLDRRWLMIESNGNKISTPNLPLFSKLEFDRFCNIEGIFNFYEN